MLIFRNIKTALFDSHQETSRLVLIIIYISLVEMFILVWLWQYSWIFELSKGRFLRINL